MTKTQLRGHCQCCGREQAVTRGSMAHHGYTVQDGYFSGKCQGHKYAPIEQKRDIADMLIAQVTADAIKFRAQAEALKAGTLKPQLAKSGNRLQETIKGRVKFVDHYCPFDEAPAHFQAEEIRSDIWRTEQRARAAESWADSMTRIVNEYHGQQMRVVVVVEPEALVPGEQRIDANGRTLTYSYTRAARVHWKLTKEDGRTFNGWTGVQAWRKMPLKA